MGDATELLHHWQQGDNHARDRLVEMIYQDLYDRASWLLSRRGPRQPLQATELVNESFIKLVGGNPGAYQDRQHFLATAAVVMRNVLADCYRQAAAQKRSVDSVTLATHHLAMPTPVMDFETLDAAMTELQRVHPALAEVVSLKFFSGMTHSEIATYLDRSESTIKRQWRAAKAWLSGELAKDRLGKAQAEPSSDPQE